MGIGIIGVGKCIPSIIRTNDEGFAQKTGIHTRHIIDSQYESLSWISARATMDAIMSADKETDVLPNTIGLVVGCSYAGDNVFPASACSVQKIIRAEQAGSFDIHANCTGFQVGLTIASDRMIVSGDDRYAVVFGGAAQSRFVDQNSDIAPYFGDGAGAAVLGRVPEGYGILASEIFSNTSVLDSVRLEWGASNYVMDGVEVWKQVVQYQPVAIHRALAKIGKTVQDVDFFIFHQANVRLIEYLMGKMKLPMSKTHITADRYGNTADASLPITLCEAVELGKINRDDLVVISGVGAGFIFGATAMRWY